MNDYSDIINLPRHVSLTHKHMSNSDRAAQFAPFAALTGYENIIKEVARKTTSRLILSSDQKEKINETLLFLKNKNEKISISIIYFEKDKKKSGGRYIKIEGEFLKFNSQNTSLILSDKTNIPLKDIFEIEIINNK